MAKYMINIHYGDLKKRDEVPSYSPMILEKYQKWSEKIGRNILTAHKLKDKVGRRLDFDGKQIKDGPFTETKETIGGFYIVEAENYQQAAEMASDCPTLLYQGGYLEIREV